MYFNEHSIIFRNGEFIKASEATASLYNQTMHYGSGVFEGIRAYHTSNGTRIFKAKEHYDRLLYSAECMHIKIPYSSEELTAATYNLLERNGFSDAYIRPLVYLGSNMSLTPVAEVNVAIMVWEWGKYLGDKLLRVFLSSYQRPNPRACFVDAKVVGHYTNSILATTEAKSKGYDEALLTDMNGYVAEGSGANFFIEKDGKLYTAPKGNILMGITRATVLELAQQLNITVVQQLFTPDEALAADSAFFCGTAAEVIGLHSLNEVVYPLKWQDSLGFQIQQAYSRLVLQP